ncbi:MAG: RHS repeat-associated core domain-containing protein, partial [Eubacterium sp.]|nr:RHS repeat-associated core domain-containing protein [Eubacterium sp.]
PYQYNAEYTDSSTGLQYLRARYYDSSQGRFTTKDTYLGTIPNPLSRNLYTYVENNPLNYIDPSGHLIIPGSKTANHMPIITPISQQQINREVRKIITDPFSPGMTILNPTERKAYYDKRIENIYGNYAYGPSYSNPTGPYRYDPVTNPFGQGKNASKRTEAQTALQKHIAKVQEENYKKYCENGADRAKDNGTTFSLGPKEYAALAFGSIMVAKVGVDDFTSGVISSVADNALYPILFLSGKLSGTEIGSFSEFSNYTFDEAFYIGRIAGDVIGVVVGAAEAMLGITNFITGLDTVVTGTPALVSGVASGEGVIVVAAGAVVAVAGAVEVAAGGATIQKSFANLLSDIDAFSSSKSNNLNWTSHGYKHFPDKNKTWKEIVKSTENGPAKYSKNITDIESFEREAW